MKQTARIISTYSADVMGVCSALFELGGMTVMHDASGCNSTYTTHDEPRWFDMDRRRPGLCDGCAALIGSIDGDGFTVTLANTDTLAHTLCLQGGAYGEHEILSVGHKYIIIICDVGLTDGCDFCPAVGFGQ